jgi:hypothetical protein
LLWQPIAATGDEIILAGQNPGPTFCIQNIDRWLLSRQELLFISY